MTDDPIREVIKDRLKAINGSCNRSNLDHNDGVFRGLIWALNGLDPGTFLTSNIPAMLVMACIPYTIEDGFVRF